MFLVGNLSLTNFLSTFHQIDIQTVERLIRSATTANGHAEKTVKRRINNKYEREKIAVNCFRFIYQ